MLSRVFAGNGGGIVSSSDVVESVVTKKKSFFVSFFFFFVSYFLWDRKLLEYIPIEFRLLLSPDRDCESTQICDPFVLGLTILVGLERRFSRSTSDRNGLFGVNC